MGGGKISDSLLSENLLLGTKDFSGDWKNLSDGKWQKEDETYGELTVYSRSEAYGGIYQEHEAHVGEKYTFSVFAKASADVECLAFLTLYQQGETAPNSLTFNVTTDWKRYFGTFAITKDGKIGARIEFQKKVAEPTTLYVCGYKLERGENNYPIWTQSPYDYLVDLETRVKALEIKNGIVSADSAMELPSADMAENDMEITE